MRVYQHFKGNYYEHLMEALSTDTGKELVIYRAISDGKVWARKKEEFFEHTPVDGRLVPRFRRIHNHEVSGDMDLDDTFHQPKIY